MSEQKIYFGADYNPEQWDEKVWLEDIKYMKQAGVNIVTPAVFSWAMIETKEGEYYYEWLDRVLDLLYENGISVDLGTSTATQPPWLSVNYPNILPVNRQGNRTGYGGRQFYCPNSEEYRTFSTRLVQKTAEHYQNHPAIKMWHINNEYMGNSLEDVCFCPTCQGKFRQWLKDGYGSIKVLNESWGTAFWSQRYNSFEEISAPFNMSTHPSQVLDYLRFMGHSFYECCQAEANILREITPDIPVTTNFYMPEFKRFDHTKWVKSLDIISFDCYPQPIAEYDILQAAMYYDLMYSLKQSPFLLMEQSPTMIDWRPYNPLKRPGVMALWSMQAIAHGADGVMFFQWRQSRKGNEKFHGAVISHLGTDCSRVYQEVAALGQQLGSLSELTGSIKNAKIAFFWDYDSFLSVDQNIPHQDITYLNQFFRYYQAVLNCHYDVEIISSLEHIEHYQVVIAPLYYMVKLDDARKIQSYTVHGGIFITSFFSGIVDENDGAYLNGYPGPLKETMGLIVEEYDSLSPSMKNRITYQGMEYECSQWCDLICTTTAKPLAFYQSDFYGGTPCMTENQYGEGKAYYLGTQVEESLLEIIFTDIFKEAEISPLIPQKISGLEVCRRLKDGMEYLFLLNHNDTAVKVYLEDAYYSLLDKKIVQSIDLPKKGFLVLNKSI